MVADSGREMRHDKLEVKLMAKCAVPLYEPVPDYMRKLLLMGARFVDGNTGEGAAGDDSADDSPDDEAGTDDTSSQDDADNSRDDGSAEDDDSDDDSDDEPEGDDFKKVALADLIKERNRRKKLQSSVESLNSTLAEKDTAISERDARIEVLNLALTHGLSEKDDLDLLTEVKDSKKREALAARLAKADGGDGVVRESGSGGGDVGGSVAAGYDLYKSRKQ